MAEHDDERARRYATGRRGYGMELPGAEYGEQERAGEEGPYRRDWDTNFETAMRNRSFDYGPGYSHDYGYDVYEGGYGHGTGGWRRTRHTEVDPDDLLPHGNRYGEPRTRREWMIEGPHTGRGPRGYRRSRERIEEEVYERLTHYGHLDARSIQVRVDDNGEVTLEGQVDSRRDKRMAEHVIESIRGIRDIHNRLHIRR